MLDGTSPFSLGSLIEVLNATSLSSSHAEYLGGGDQLVFEYARSIEPALSYAANRLLTHLMGKDYHAPR